MNYNDIHSKENLRNFGSILFTDLFHEENFGKINLIKLGELKINVYANEGPIPHFHIESTDRNFICCVEIYHPNYFSHDNKIDKLTDRQVKDLNKFMSTKFKPRPDFTVWEAIDFYWVAFNDPERKKYNNYTFYQPDYSKLNC